MSSNYIDLLDILKVEGPEHNNKLKFTLRNKSEIYSQYSSIIDPSFDQIFKTIFKNDKILIHLLNSLLLPDDNENKIIKIERINENTILSNSIKGSLRFDMTCKAEYQNNDINIIKFIDLEMEYGNDTELKDRLFQYGSFLYSKYSIKTIVLALVNNKGKNNQQFLSSWIRNVISDEKGNNIIDMNKFDIALVNVNDVLQKTSADHPIFIMGKKIGASGKRWLKLLTIRHWSHKLSILKYAMPIFIINLPKEIEHAIHLLKNIDEFQLASLENDIKCIDSFIQNVRKEAIEEAIKEVKKKATKKEINNLIKLYLSFDQKTFESIFNQINNEEIKYEESYVKEKIESQQNMEGFISFLKKKRKIKE